MKRTSYYQSAIGVECARMARRDVDPRHVEGFMRLEHGCLDALSAAEFRREVKISIACIDASGVAESESLAKSYGL